MAIIVGSVREHRVLCKNLVVKGLELRAGLYYMRGRAGREGEERMAECLRRETEGESVTGEAALSD